MAQREERYLDEHGNPIGRDTVEKDFNERKSIRALSTREGRGDRDIPEEADNDPSYAYAEERVRERASREASNDASYARGDRENIRNIREGVSRSQSQIKTPRASSVPKPGVGTFGRFAGISAAWTAYTLQLFFGVISLLGIGGQAMANELVNGNFIGRAINAVTKMVGIDLTTLIPFDYIGFGFWALSAMVALCTFIAFLLLFTFTHASVLSSAGMTLITALTFALSILPISNLFPWIPLWVMAVNFNSIAVYTKQLFRG